MLAPSDVYTIGPYLCFEVRRGRCGRASEIFDGNVMRQAMVYSEHGFEFHCNNRGFFLPDSKARSPQKYDRYSQGQPISQQISLLFSSDFSLDNAIRNRITSLIGLQLFGEVLERLNRPVSKTGVGVTPPWVRIPPSPLPMTPGEGLLRCENAIGIDVQ